MTLCRIRMRGLLSVALLALAVPHSRAQLPPSASTSAAGAFAVVSIRPSPDSEAGDWGMGLRGRNFWATHVTTEELIAWAYGLNASQMEHAPGWLAVDRYDVEGVPDTPDKLTREQYAAMLQAVLAERFGLRSHPASKVLPVYVFTVAEGGLKIPASNDATARHSWGAHRGWLSVQNMTFADVARVTQRSIFDRPVLDSTGLTGRYSFVLTWRADDTQFTRMQGVDVPVEDGTEDGTDIATAAREKLGLRIEAKKALAPTLVIEAISKPQPN